MLGVHDGSVVWSGVRMRGYPPRCVTSKSVCLDEFCDACQGRVETVLDYFQSCQSDEWWEQLNISHVCQVELSPRISSIYENVRNFTVFEKKKSFDYLPLGEILSVCFTADKIERNCHAAFSV